MHYKPSFPRVSILRMTRTPIRSHSLALNLREDRLHLTRSTAATRANSGTQVFLPAGFAAYQLIDSFQKSHSLLSDVLNSDINSFGSMTVSNQVKISSAGLSSLFPAINSPLSKWPYEHGPPRKHTLESVKTVTLILTQMEGSHQGCQFSLLCRDSWGKSFCFQGILMSYHHIPSFAFFLVHKAASICEHLQVWVLQWLVHQVGMAGIDQFSYLNTIMHKLFSIIWEHTDRMQGGGCFQSDIRIIQQYSLILSTSS